MPRIASWQDYPEFLERFEEQTGISMEYVRETDIDTLREYLERFGFKTDSELAARSLQFMSQATATEGAFGYRLEFYEDTEQYRWRDLETGRYTSAPFGSPAEAQE